MANPDALGEIDAGLGETDAGGSIDAAASGCAPAPGWTNYTVDNSALRSSVVRALAVDDSDRLWVAYSWEAPGVSILAEGAWTHIEGSDWVDNAVTTIFHDSSGATWLGTRDGLLHFDGQSWSRYGMADGLANGHVLSIFEDRAQTLWIGTVDGLSHYDGTSFTNYAAEPGGLASSYVYSIAQAADGAMWFAHGLAPVGVTRLNASGFETLTTADGLPSDQVLTAYSDHNGDIWLGTYANNSGIVRYAGGAFYGYDLTDTTTCSSVFAAHGHGDTELWFGTSCSGGTLTYDGSGWSVLRTDNSGVVTNNVLALDEDSCGNLWLGGYGGLSSYSM